MQNGYYHLIIIKMKTKVFLLCAMTLLLAQAAKAQMWIGGSVGFDYSNSDKKTKIANLSLGPTVGYSLNPKWDLVLGFSYSLSRQKTEGETITAVSKTDVNNKAVSNSISVDPFVRYSFLKTGIVTFFVDGGLGYTYGKSDSDNSQKITSFVESQEDRTLSYTSKSTQNTFSIGFRPGVKLELSEKIELESHIGFLGYSHRKTESQTNDVKGEDHTLDKFGLNANCTALNFGLIYKF